MGKGWAQASRSKIGVQRDETSNQTESESRHSILYSNAAYFVNRLHATSYTLVGLDLNMENHLCPRV